MLSLLPLHCHDKSVQDVISSRKYVCVREAAKKKSSFFSGLATKAITPPPRLSGQSQRKKKKPIFSQLFNEFFLNLYNQKEFRLKLFYFEFKWLSFRYIFQVKTSLQSIDSMVDEKKITLYN